jgi:hypothetical protein
LANVVPLNLYVLLCPPITMLLLASFGISAQHSAVLHVQATGIAANGQPPELMDQILLDLSSRLEILQ